MNRRSENKEYFWGEISEPLNRFYARVDEKVNEISDFVKEKSLNELAEILQEYMIAESVSYNFFSETCAMGFQRKYFENRIETVKSLLTTSIIFQGMSTVDIFIIPTEKGVGIGMYGCMTDVNTISNILDITISSTQRTNIAALFKYHLTIHIGTNAEVEKAIADIKFLDLAAKFVDAEKLIEALSKRYKIDSLKNPEKVLKNYEKLFEELKEKNYV